MQIKKRQRKSRRPAARTRPHEGLVAVVRSFDEARQALAVGHAAGAAVTLLSPPGAAAYLGVGFFWALVEAARAEFPRVLAKAVMDCGEDPGWALAALRTGFECVVLRGNPRARARVAAIARAMGATVLRHPPRTGRRGGGEK